LGCHDGIPTRLVEFDAAIGLCHDVVEDMLILMHYWKEKRPGIMGSRRDQTPSFSVGRICLKIAALYSLCVIRIKLWC